MKTGHCTYRVTWSAEEGEHVGLCAEFPSLSWLAVSPELHRKLVIDTHEQHVSLNRLVSATLAV